MVTGLAYHLLLYIFQVKIRRTLSHETFVELRKKLYPCIKYKNLFISVLNDTEVCNMNDSFLLEFYSIKVSSESNRGGEKQEILESVGVISYVTKT